MPSIKDVKRTTGDYHIQAEEDIHLETQYSSGNNGTVYIWGNLYIEGTRTEVNTLEISIDDKVLYLNKNEPGVPSALRGAGVSGDGIAGISISRGGSSSPNDNANLVYNQSKSWSYNGNTTLGLWDFIVGPPSGGIGDLSGINVAAIRTGGVSNDLSLLGAENSLGTVTLDGVANYTNRIITRNKPNDVPNKGYVDYAVEYAPDRRRIQLNYRNNAGTLILDPLTYSEFVDVDVPGYTVAEPQLRTSIGGNQWLTVYNNRMVLGQIKILDGNEITMNANDVKMVLSTKPGGSSTQNPSVEIATSLSLKIDRVYNDPTTETDRIKLYAKDEGAGGTGIYFVNNIGVRDELPSKRRAFFTSLMF